MFRLACHKAKSVQGADASIHEASWRSATARMNCSGSAQLQSAVSGDNGQGKGFSVRSCCEIKAESQVELAITFAAALEQSERGQQNRYPGERPAIDTREVTNSIQGNYNVFGVRVNIQPLCRLVRVKPQTANVRIRRASSPDWVLPSTAKWRTHSVTSRYAALSAWWISSFGKSMSAKCIHGRAGLGITADV